MYEPKVRNERSAFFILANRGVVTPHTSGVSLFHDVGITILRKSEARSLTTEAKMIIPSVLILPAVDATYQNLHVTPFADVLPSTSLRPFPTRWTAILDIIKSARYSLQCCPVWVPVAI